MEKKNITLLIIYLNVILYATCFQMQRPLEPFLVQKLDLEGDGTSSYANLNSFFSFVQTIGSYVTGILLDKYGPKFGFILSFISSGLSYGILAQSTSMNLLYISKIPTIFQAGFLCAQLAVSKSTTDGAERVAALGRLTVCYTIGSVIGPAIGGYLGASGDYYLSANLAAIGSLISTILVILMPDDAKTEEKSPEKTRQSSHSGSIVSIIRSVWLLLGAKVVTSVANAMFQTGLPLVLKNSFSLDEAGMGLAFSSMSVCNSIVNAFFLGPIVALVGDLPRLISFSLGGMTLLSVLQALAPLLPLPETLGSGLIPFFMFTLLLGVLQYLLATSLTSESTARVSDAQKGMLLGMEHSLFALARIGAPQAGTALLKYGGVPGLSGTCGSIFAVVLVVWLSFQNSIQTPPRPTILTEKNDERKEK